MKAVLKTCAILILSLYVSVVLAANPIKVDIPIPGYKLGDTVSQNACVNGSCPNSFKIAVGGFGWGCNPGEAAFTKTSMTTVSQIGAWAKLDWKQIFGPAVNTCAAGLMSLKPVLRHIIGSKIQVVYCYPCPDGKCPTACSTTSIWEADAGSVLKKCEFKQSNAWVSCEQD